MTTELSLTCPSCNCTMETVQEPDIIINRCPECKGTFLEKGELNVLATGMSGDIEYCSIDKKDHEDQYPVRNCPKCNEKPMQKICLLCYSDIIFDFCSSCESFFVDQGELEAMNIELSEMTKDKTLEEFRGKIQDHLVRVDKLDDVMVATHLGGMYTTASSITYVRISVFFNSTLPFKVRLYSEKWTHKILKALRFFRQQDIQIGASEFDGAFIIQGDNVEQIQKHFSSSEVQKPLLEFIQQKPKITNPGTLEVLEDRLVYQEGPYTGDVKYDVEADENGIIEKLLQIACALDKAPAV